mmetsp:Transcript_77110/g.204722  ORF Transcript_77110/g.204722 Transcript_77110/m.204722 type:complete len:544 (+) Transcript_77110:443-2074(+)
MREVRGLHVLVVQHPGHLAEPLGRRVVLVLAGNEVAVPLLVREAAVRGGAGPRVRQAAGGRQVGLRAGTVARRRARAGGAAQRQGRQGHGARLPLSASHPVCLVLQVLLADLAGLLLKTVSLLLASSLLLSQHPVPVAHRGRQGLRVIVQPIGALQVEGKPRRGWLVAVHGREQSGGLLQRLLLPLFPSLCPLQLLQQLPPVPLSAGRLAVHKGPEPENDQLVVERLLDCMPALALLRAGRDDIAAGGDDPGADHGRVENLLQRRPVGGFRAQRRLDQRSRSRAAGRSYGGIVTFDDLQCQAIKALGIECPLPVHDLIENAAKRPNITLVAVRLVVDELGRHVERRANLRFRKVCCGVEHLGDPEVAQLQSKDVFSPVTGEEYVLRLQVPVQDLLCVQSVQRQGDLHEPFQEVLLVGHLLGLLRRLQVGVDVPVLAVLHEDAQVSQAVDKRVLVGDDVGVLDASEQLHLELRRLAPLLRCVLQLDVLHHVLPLLPSVQYQEHLSEGATADRPDNLVVVLVTMRNCGSLLSPAEVLHHNPDGKV